MLRYASVFGLFLIGAVPISGLFYEIFLQLPPSTSLLWKDILGVSFAVVAIGLLAGWLILLSFDFLMGSARSSACS